ncbi:MAG: hypothetical protein QOF20_2531, partial [Acidimicrobiaceae bacterium]|nr:hypothetical protein [Acidimicrobiaceae bacterium]
MVPTSARRQTDLLTFAIATLGAALSLVGAPFLAGAASAAPVRSTSALKAAAASSFPASPPVSVCGDASLLTGPSTPPAGSVTVAAGDNSAVNWNRPGVTFWFAPGTHTLGSGQYSQIMPPANSVFVGAPGAVIDGQG